MRLIAAALVLVACNGTPQPTTPKRQPAAKSVQINKPGEPVDVMAALPDGYVVVVDFWGEHCGACHVVGGMLAVQVAKHDLVLIRKVDVGDGFTKVAEQHDISSLPHYRVYDKHKRLRADLLGNDCLKAPEIAIALAAED